MDPAGDKPMVGVYRGFPGFLVPAGCPVVAGAEKPQEEALGLEFEGCPGENGAGLSPGAAGTKMKLLLVQLSWLLPFNHYQ